VLPAVVPVPSVVPAEVVPAVTTPLLSLAVVPEVPEVPLVPVPAVPSVALAPVVPVIPLALAPEEPALAPSLALASAVPLLPCESLAEPDPEALSAGPSPPQAAPTRPTMPTIPTIPAMLPAHRPYLCTPEFGFIPGIVADSPREP
jgi:hypothetical protein